MKLNEIKKLYSLFTFKLDDQKSFEKFLSEAFSDNVNYTLPPESDGVLTCKIIDALHKNPEWIDLLGRFLSLQNERSKVLLDAILSALSQGYVEAKRAYQALKEGLFKPLINKRAYILPKVFDSVKNVVPFMYVCMTDEEKKAFYGRIGRSSVDIDILRMILHDYKNSDEFNKRFLTKTLLDAQVDESDVKLLDRNNYVEILSDIIVSFVREDSYYSYYNFYGKLSPLIGVLSVSDFRALAKKVKDKFLEVSYPFRTDYVKFLMYALDVIENFPVNFCSDIKGRSKGYYVDSFISNVVFLIPYLDSYKFWNFASYLESFVGKDSVYLAYLLNNSFILENKEFVLNALKIYLDSDVKRKLEGHKLLIDADIVNKLSLKQSVTLALRTVGHESPVRFKFTEEAFNNIKMKLASAILTGKFPDLKEMYEKFISLFEGV